MNLKLRQPGYLFIKLNQQYFFTVCIIFFLQELLFKIKGFVNHLFLHFCTKKSSLLPFTTIKRDKVKKKNILTTKQTQMNKSSASL